MAKKIEPLHKMLTWADGVTLLNAACGLGSMFASIIGNFQLAALLLLGAMCADFLDGKVARLFGQQGKLGKDLDSLADTVSFGVAPCVLAFTLGNNDLMSILLFIVFLCCGIVRLARFNVLTIKGYVGMPITVNGVLIPAFYFLGLLHAPWTQLLFLGSALLMVSPFRFEKPF